MKQKHYPRRTMLLHASMMYYMIFILSTLLISYDNSLLHVLSNVMKGLISLIFCIGGLQKFSFVRILLRVGFSSLVEVDSLIQHLRYSLYQMGGGGHLLCRMRRGVFISCRGLYNAYPILVKCRGGFISFGCLYNAYPLLASCLEFPWCCIKFQETFFSPGQVGKESMDVLVCSLYASDRAKGS